MMRETMGPDLRCPLCGRPLWSLRDRHDCHRPSRGPDWEAWLMLACFAVLGIVAYAATGGWRP